MFDIGMTEIMVIAVVAIVVVGPKDLPGLLRNAAKYMGQIKNLARDFQGQMNDAIREADIADLKKMNPLDDIKSDMDEYMDSARAFDEPDEDYIADGEKLAKGDAIDAGVPANDTPKPAAAKTASKKAPAKKAAAPKKPAAKKPAAKKTASAKAASKAS